MSTTPQSAPPRVYFVGTDTAVGKTALVCALLERATAIGVRALPYKPVQSRDPDEPSDADRLVAAAARPGLTTVDLVAFDYAIPIAPGLADDPAPFLANAPGDATAVARSLALLERTIAGHPSDVILIEGAGGLWVPMPGGTWQPPWIASLATDVIVVARAGLGTINHTLCTIDGLRALGIEPRGFYLSEVDPPDASVPLNARVIVAARAVAHLGTLPHRAAPSRCLLTPLLERLRE